MLCKNLDCHFLPTPYILISSRVRPPPRPPAASSSAIVQSSFIQQQMADEASPLCTGGCAEYNIACFSKRLPPVCLLRRLGAAAAALIFSTPHWPPIPLIVLRSCGSHSNQEEHDEHEEEYGALIHGEHGLMRLNMPWAGGLPAAASMFAVWRRADTNDLRSLRHPGMSAKPCWEE